MSDSRRAKRVASLIRSELSRAIVEDVADPSLHHIFINDVDLTPDLKSARVYYGVGAEIPKKELDKGIKRVIPYFRKRLGENLGLRFVPELLFERDSHTDSAGRVMSLLDEIKRGDSP